MRKGILCLLAVFLLMIPAIRAEAVEVSEDNAEFDYTFESTTEGEEISTQSDGKSKVLIFFSTGCDHCKNVLRNLASSEWVQKGELADVYAITGNVMDIEAIEEFRETYCSEAGGMIKFGFGARANDAMFDYADAMEAAGGGIAGTPLIAMVDAKNRLRYVTNGAAAANGIEEKLTAMKSDPDDTQKPGDSQKPGDTENPDDPGSSDDTQKPGDEENPDDTQKPDDTEKPGDNQKPEKPEGSSGEGEGRSRESGCSHVEETVWVSEATATSNAMAVYRCVKCGATLGYGEVVNSAYITFLEETADAILNAEQESVVIDTRIWVSFNRSVFEAIRNRPDVAVTVNYYYEGQPYVLQIPAGTDVDLLMDENGFGGFRYIEKVLSAKD